MELTTNEKCALRSLDRNIRGHTLESLPPQLRDFILITITPLLARLKTDVEKQTILCICGKECVIARNSRFEYQGHCSCGRVWTLCWEMQ